MEAILDVPGKRVECIGAARVAVDADDRRGVGLAPFDIVQGEAVDPPGLAPGLLRCRHESPPTLEKNTSLCQRSIVPVTHHANEIMDVSIGSNKFRSRRVRGHDETATEGAHHRLDLVETRSVMNVE